MGSIPFSLYDFFGYLVAGVMCLVAADHMLDLGWLSTDTPPLQLQAFWLILAYVTGHVNAHWASWFLEKRVARRLGPPSKTLFDRQSEHRFFKHYRSPLSEGTAEATLDKYERMTGSRKPGEDMFLFCYHHVKEQCPQAAARLNTFVSLYGFARNLSFATLVLAASFAIAAARGLTHSWVLTGVSLLAAITFFYRYLKFYRMFSVEVFASFRTGVKEDRNRTAPDISTAPSG